MFQFLDIEVRICLVFCHGTDQKVREGYEYGHANKGDIDAPRGPEELFGVLGRKVYKLRAQTRLVLL